MSDKRDDGGPAFPVSVVAEIGNDINVRGMSLRDWFAGQALAGTLANPDTDVQKLCSAPAAREALAVMALAMGDAMLRARERERENENGDRPAGGAR